LTPQNVFTGVFVQFFYQAMGAPLRNIDFSLIELDFLRSLRLNGSKANTLKGYESTFASIRRLCDGRPADKLLVFDVRTIYDHEPWSQRTRRMHLARLRALHGWMKAEGFPHCDKVLTQKLPRREKSRPNPFVDAEIRRLRFIARNLTDKHLEWCVFFLLLDATGVRPCEPLTLRIEDIDGVFENQKRDRIPKILFRQTKRGPFLCQLHEIAQIGRPSAEDLPALLRRYKRLRDLGNSGPLFNATSAQWVYKQWLDFSGLAGVSGQLRQLRDTFACELLTQTRDIELVRVLMNHSRAEITETYAEYISLPLFR